MQVLQELESTFETIDRKQDPDRVLQLTPPKGGSAWRLLQVVNLGVDHYRDTKFQIIWAREVSPCPAHPGTSGDR